MNNLQDHIDTQQCSRHHHSSYHLKHLLDWNNLSISSNLPSQNSGMPSGMIQPAGIVAPVVEGVSVGNVESRYEQSPRSNWHSALFRGPSHTLFPNHKKNRISTAATAHIMKE